MSSPPPFYHFMRGRSLGREASTSSPGMIAPIFSPTARKAVLHTPVPATPPAAADSFKVTVVQPSPPSDTHRAAAVDMAATEVLMTSTLSPPGALVDVGSPAGGGWGGTTPGTAPTATPAPTTVNPASPYGIAASMEVSLLKQRLDATVSELHALRRATDESGSHSVTDMAKECQALRRTVRQLRAEQQTTINAAVDTARREWVRERRRKQAADDAAVEDQIKLQAKEMRDNFRQQVESLNCRLEDSKTRESRQEAAAVELRTTVDTLQDRVVSLNAELAAARCHSDDLERKLSRFANETSSLVDSARSSVQADLEAMTASRDALQTRVVSLEAKVGHMEELHDSAVGQTNAALSRVEAAQAELEDTRAELGRIAEELAATDAKAEAAQAEAEAEASRLHTALESAQVTIRDLKKERQALHAQADSAQQASNDANRQAAASQSELLVLQSKLAAADAQVQRLEADGSTADTSLQDVQAQLATATASAAALNSELHAMSGVKDAAVQEADNLRSQVTELASSLAKAVEAASGEREATRAAALAGERVLEARTQELAAARAANDALSQQLVAAARRPATVDVGLVTDPDTVVMEVRASLKAVQDRAAEDLASWQAEEARLRHEVKVLAAGPPTVPIATQTDDDDYVQDLHETVEELQANLNATQMQVSVLSDESEAALADALAQADAADARCRQQAAELREAASTLEAAQAKVAALQARVTELDTRGSKAVQELESKVAPLTDELDASRKHVADLQRRLGASTIGTEAAESSVATLTDELDASRKHVADLQRRLDASTIGTEAAESSVATLTDELDASRKHVADLHRRLDEAAASLKAGLWQANTERAAALEKLHAVEAVVTDLRQQLADATPPPPPLTSDVACGTEPLPQEAPDHVEHLEAELAAERQRRTLYEQTMHKYKAAEAHAVHELGNWRQAAARAEGKVASLHAALRQTAGKLQTLRGDLKAHKSMHGAALAKATENASGLLRRAVEAVQVHCARRHAVELEAAVQGERAAGDARLEAAAKAFEARMEVASRLAAVEREAKDAEASMAAMAQFSQQLVTVQASASAAEVAIVEERLSAAWRATESRLEQQAATVRDLEAKLVLLGDTGPQRRRAVAAAVAVAEESHAAEVQKLHAEHQLEMSSVKLEAEQHVSHLQESHEATVVALRGRLVAHRASLRSWMQQLLELRDGSPRGGGGGEGMDVTASALALLDGDDVEAAPASSTDLSNLISEAAAAAFARGEAKAHAALEDAAASREALDAQRRRVEDDWRQRLAAAEEAARAEAALALSQQQEQLAQAHAHDKEEALRQAQAAAEESMQTRLQDAQRLEQERYGRVSDALRQETARLEDTRARLTAAQAELSAAQDIIRTLEGSVDAGQASLSRLEATLAAVEQERQGLRAKLEAGSQQIADAKAASTSLASAVQQWKATSQQATEEAGRWKATAGEATSLAEQLRQQHVAALDQQASEHAAELSALQATVDSLKNDLVDASSENHALTVDNQILLDKLGGVQRRIGDAEARVGQLSTAVQASQAAEAAGRTRESATKAALQREEEHHQALRVEAATQMKALQAKVAAVEAALAAKVAAMEAVQDALRTERERASVALVTIATQEAAMMDTKAELDDAKDTAIQLGAQCEQLKAALKAGAKQAEGLQVGAAAAKAAQKAAEAEKADVEQRLAVLVGVASSAQAGLGVANEQLEAKTEAEEALTQQLEAKTQEAADLAVKVADLEAKTRAMEAKAAEVDAAAQSPPPPTPAQELQDVKRLLQSLARTPAGSPPPLPASPEEATVTPESTASTAVSTAPDAGEDVKPGGNLPVADAIPPPVTTVVGHARHAPRSLSGAMQSVAQPPKASSPDVAPAPNPSKGDAAQRQSASKPPPSPKPPSKPSKARTKSKAAARKRMARGRSPHRRHLPPTPSRSHSSSRNKPKPRQRQGVRSLDRGDKRPHADPTLCFLVKSGGSVHDPAEHGRRRPWLPPHPHPAIPPPPPCDVVVPARDALAARAVERRHSISLPSWLAVVSPQPPRQREGRSRSRGRSLTRSRSRSRSRSQADADIDRVLTEILGVGPRKYTSGDAPPLEVLQALEASLGVAGKEPTWS